MTESVKNCTTPGCDGLRMARRKVCRACYNAARNMQLKKRRQEIHAEIRKYQAEHPCIDCGETDPVVLQFDHRDGEHKTANVSDMVSRGRSLQSILEEIGKCDVRCANCHARRTAKQHGWYGK